MRYALPPTPFVRIRFPIGTARAISHGLLILPYAPELAFPDGKILRFTYVEEVSYYIEAIEPPRSSNGLE